MGMLLSYHYNDAPAEAVVVDEKAAPKKATKKAAPKKA